MEEESVAKVVESTGCQVCLVPITVLVQLTTYLTTQVVIRSSIEYFTLDAAIGRLLQKILSIRTFCQDCRAHTCIVLITLCVQDLDLVEHCLLENGYDSDLAIVELLQLMDLSVDHCERHMYSLSDEYLSILIPF